jgi:hypothetical protein
MSTIILFLKRFSTKAALLSGLFALAIVVRLPNLDRPLSKHHEFCTALSLIVLQGWYDGGIANYHYAPSTNLPQETNSGIRNLIAQSVERNGRYYYISHPPLAYYLPFLVFKSLHVRPNTLGLQLFNIASHLLSALLIFLLARMLIPGLGFGPWAACVVYLFNPATLWFQGNVYMSDMLVQVFFLMAAYFFARLCKEELLARRVSLMGLGLGLSVFAAAYTEWLGFCLALVLLIVGIWRKVFRWKVAVVIVVAVTAAIMLTVYTYGGIAGWHAMIEYYSGRFDQRGLGGDVIGSLVQLGKNYLYSHLPVLLFLAAGLWFLFRGNRTGVVVPMPKSMLMIIGLTAAVVVLHHIIFLQHSGHDFAVLKSAVPLSLLAGWLIHALVQAGIVRVWSATVVIGLVAVTSIAQYYYVNRPGEVSIKGDRYDAEMEIGLRIASNVADDQVAMIKDVELTPQVLYYAQRNVQPVRHLAEAYEFMRRHPVGKGVLLWIEGGEWKKRIIIREDQNPAQER